MPEKARWRLGASKAREHAQLCSGIDFEEHLVVDEVRALGLVRWQQEPDFPEVPLQKLSASDWKLVRYDAWKHEDGILRLEARSLERGLSRFPRFPGGSNVRLLMLCDDMAGTLTVGRSRARDFGLLVQIRRINAWCLLRSVKLYVRWVPSE